MGKRKRRTDCSKAPADSIPEEEDPQSERSSFDQPENSEDVMDTSLKRLPGPQSPLNQNDGSSRTILLRHSRHPFGRHYSRRSSFNHHSDASPSTWKGNPAAYSTKLSFKLENKDLLNFPYQESRDRIFQKPERIRPRSSFENTLSRDTRKMECTICHKRLKKNPLVSDDSISLTDLSVVAVLVCGHAYHADCLEQKTSYEYIQDPPCPLCVSRTPRK